MRVRPYCRIKPLRDGDERSYLVEDPVASHFFRIGVREYAVLNALLEFTDLADAFQTANARLGEDAFEESEFLAVIQWLQNENLLDTQGQLDETRRPRAKNILSKLNLLSFKISFGNPDRLLDVIAPRLRFMTTAWFFSVWIAFCCSALGVISTHWVQFSAAAAGIFYVNNWLSLIAIWSVIKVTHELFHGVVCKRFGGNVYEAGVILILFIPIGYVDATSAWRFPSKWARIFTSLAGVYVELLCAAVATWVWVLSEPGIINDLAYKAIFLASVTTVLFNLNPLMRFDGYFALSDFANSPNLYAHGRRYVIYLFRRYGLGDRIQFDSTGISRENFVRIYGVLAFCWRTTVIVSLLIAANAMFHGAGVIIAASAFCVIIVVPLWRMVAGFLRDRPTRSIATSLLRVVALFGCAAGFATVVSWPNDVVAPAIVEFVDSHPIRIESDGFVDQVSALPGAAIENDATILTMRNPALVQKLATLGLEIKQSELRIRILRNAERVAESENERRNLEQLNRLLVATQEEFSALEVRSDASGRVYGKDLQTLLGRYLRAGEQVAEIIGSKGKEIHISLDQASINLVHLNPGMTVAIWFSSAQGDLSGAQIEHVDPRISKRLDYPSLAGVYGGPLPVRLVNAGENDPDTPPHYEYLEPRATIVAAIDPSDAERLFAGEIGYARLPGVTVSLAQRLVQGIESWVLRLVRQAQS